jgi:hypothetical protein
MNPMMMAFMQQFMQAMNGNKNFQMGGGEGNDIEAMTQINNDLRRSVANQLGINPQNVINMSSEEIGRLAERVSNKNNKSDSDKSVSDSDSSSSNNGKKNRSSKQKASTVEVLKTLLELKARNNKDKKNLTETVTDVVSKLGTNKKKIDTDESESRESKKTTKIIDSKKKSVKKEELSESEKSEESEIDRPIKKVKIVEPKKKPIKKESSDSEPDIKKTNNKDTKKEIATRKKNANMTLFIECDKIEDDPANYSDYMVEFKKEFGKDLTNVTNISLTDVNIPFSPNINETSNTLTIVYNDECNELEFDTNDQKYNIDEIIDQINQSMDQIESGIFAKIKNGKIIIEQKDGEEFEIICKNNSIAKYLGFIADEYSGESKYTAENEHSFITKPIHLYLKNISPTDPFAIVYPDGKYDQKFKLSQNISKLSCIILQFKSENKKLINFAGTPHTISFSFDVLE